MPFITQGKVNLKYILIVLILAVIVGGGTLAYQYWWLPSQEAPSCSQDTDCVLAYTGEDACAPCDFSDQSYQCVSSEKAKKLEEDRIKKYGQVLCKPCYPSPLLFKCICKENSCFKTASCKKDDDCYSEAFEELYKCKESKCTFTPEEIPIDFNQISINCSADDDCMLINKELGFRCCWAGACEEIDYSLDKYISVNKESFLKLRTENCLEGDVWQATTSEEKIREDEVCGPPPLCPTRIINDNFIAQCVNNTCQKVPK